jgi:release factor glutamine methyltransferase
VVQRLRAAGCVFAEEEADLLGGAASSATQLDALVARRVGGEPLEYVLGWAEFCGLRIRVEPGVFVPRRRTAFLVERAAACVAGLRHPIIVDLCCGSGAIGAALTDRLDDPAVLATDIDPVAVRCARTNIAGRVFEGDLYDPLPNSLRGTVDLIVANAPYVPTGSIATMPREARLHEARASLDGGLDGLDLHRRITAEASAWLRVGGHLLLETSEEQADRTAGILARAGLLPLVEYSAELDATVVTGTRG